MNKNFSFEQQMALKNAQDNIYRVNNFYTPNGNYYPYPNQYYYGNYGINNISIPQIPLPQYNQYNYTPMDNHTKDGTLLPIIDEETIEEFINDIKSLESDEYIIECADNLIKDKEKSLLKKCTEACDLLDTKLLTKEFVKKYIHLLNIYILPYDLWDDELFYTLRYKFETELYNTDMKRRILKSISDDMIVKLISENYLNEIYIFDRFNSGMNLKLNDYIVSKLIDDGHKDPGFLLKINLENISLDTFSKYINKEYKIHEISTTSLLNIPVEIFNYIGDRLTENIISIFKSINNINFDTKYFNIDKNLIKEL